MDVRFLSGCECQSPCERTVDNIMKNGKEGRRECEMERKGTVEKQRGKEKGELEKWNTKKALKR